MSAPVLKKEICFVFQSVHELISCQYFHNHTLHNVTNASHYDDNLVHINQELIASHNDDTHDEASYLDKIFLEHHKWLVS